MPTVRLSYDFEYLNAFLLNKMIFKLLVMFFRYHIAILSSSFSIVLWILLYYVNNACNLYCSLEEDDP